ncbi:MAG: AMP phosphorylase [Candidatus Thermoplasmatota archaeon]|nr:AMP phosphorylase [Candidatus Thermoplasmatota archaeon]
MTKNDKEPDAAGTPSDFMVREIDLETGEYTLIMNRSDAVMLGLRSLDRVKVSSGEANLIAIVELTDSVVKGNEVGMLNKGRKTLGVSDGDQIRLVPVTKPRSIEIIKKRLDNIVLTTEEINILTEEITNHRLSDVELSAFVTSTYMHPLTNKEIKDLTLAMVDNGEIIDLDVEPIFDFHSVGGVPGNKVTLLVVPIVAAAGLYIPKTCSRAISSAGGTADILETVANVTIPGWRIKEITESVGGTIAWGGGVNIAPADDIIIRAEYPLSIDPYSQVIASVLAKKKAVGADHVLMDIPTGPHTKVKSLDLARRYARDFMDIGEQIGIHIQCAITFGGQPVGRNIGPALECKEALQILEGAPPSSSAVEKATSLAGILLEMSGYSGDGKERADELLNDGSALRKFREIIEAQGTEIRDITSEDVPVGKYSAEVLSNQRGYVSSINNKSMVRIARAAGCPHDKLGGIVLERKNGHQVDRGDVLFRIFSSNEQKLKMAVTTAQKLSPFQIEGMVLEIVPGEKVIHTVQ